MTGASRFTLDLIFARKMYLTSAANHGRVKVHPRENQP